MTHTRAGQAAADEAIPEYIAANIARESHLNAIRQKITAHDIQLIQDMERRFIGPAEMHMRQFELAELILLDLGYTQKEIYNDET